MSASTENPKQKKRVALNALRHSLLAGRVCLNSEDLAEFDHLRRMYLETLEPVGFLELEIVDELVVARWRMRRVWHVETSAIDFELGIQAAAEPDMARDLDEGSRTARAIRAMYEDATDLVNYSRYETRLHRMYYRALKTLFEIQDRRRSGKPVAKPDVSDPLPEPAADVRNELRPTVTTAYDIVSTVVAHAIRKPDPLQTVHLRRATSA